MTNATLPLHELARESRMGAHGSETDTREIRCIDLSDFDTRKPEITDQLWVPPPTSASSSCGTTVST
jgi:hypothetical protein